MSMLRQKRMSTHACTLALSGFTVTVNATCDSIYNHNSVSPRNAYYQCSEKVSGIVTARAAMHGTRRGAEPVLPGATITLMRTDGTMALDMDGNILPNAVANEQGSFEFRNVMPGVPFQMLVDASSSTYDVRPDQDIAISSGAAVTAENLAPALEVLEYEVQPPAMDRAKQYIAQPKTWATLGGLLAAATATVAVIVQGHSASVTGALHLLLGQ